MATKAGNLTNDRKKCWRRKIKEVERTVRHKERKSGKRRSYKDCINEGRNVRRKEKWRGE